MYASGPTTVWLRPPRLRRLAEEEEDRHATAYELFFDLVFVAAVSQVATALSHQLTVTGFLRFAALFIPIAWAWAGFTFYANRFDSDDVVYRLVQAVAMLAIAALAISVHSVMRGEDSAAFALSYAVTRGCLLALYARARRHANVADRRPIDLYLFAFSCGLLLWLISIAVPVPERYWLWGFSLAIELSTPVFGWRALGPAAVNVSHITERYGGFFIIVLGESVVAVVAGTADSTFTFTSSAVAVGGFVIALCLWWIYFDLADTSVVGRGSLGLIYVYSHFPLLGGVAALAAGVKVAITQADAGSLASGARWAICAGLACYLLSLALVHLAAEWSSSRDRAFLGRLATTTFVVLLAAMGGGLHPVVFIGLLAAALLAQLVLELLTPQVGAASVWTPEVSVVAPEELPVT